MVRTHTHIQWGQADVTGSNERLGTWVEIKLAIVEERFFSQSVARRVQRLCHFPRLLMMKGVERGDEKLARIRILGVYGHRPRAFVDTSTSWY